MAERMSSELGVEAVIVERKHRVGDVHAMEQDGELGLLGGTEDGVVPAVAPERIDGGAGEVDTHDPAVIGVPLDLAGGVLGVSADMR